MPGPVVRPFYRAIVKGDAAPQPAVVTQRSTDRRIHFHDSRLSTTRRENLPVFRHSHGIVKDRGRIARIGLDFDLGFKVYGSPMKISELADQAGVTTSAIRYYERIGLLPSPIRTDSGYRSYDNGATARLVFVTQPSVSDSRWNRSATCCRSGRGQLPRHA